MARPRRPFSGMDEITPHPVKWMEDEKPGALGSRQSMRWDSSAHWSYRMVNGCYDPMTYMFILDTIMNIDPDLELRANKLVEYLATRPYQMVWDAVTVGKVLSDLCDTFEDVLGAKMGLLERGKDYKGNFYRIHRNPATADLAIRLREDLYKASEAAMADWNAGKRQPLLASPLLECPAARGKWEEM